MQRSSLVFASCALLVIACGDDSTTGGAGGGGDNNGGSSVSSGGSGQTGGGSPTTSSTGGQGGSNLPDTPSFSVNFDPVTVEPGTENTQCVTKRLGNDVDIRVNQIHNVLPNGSHHLIVYRTADTEEKPTPYDCQPFADTLDPSKGSPLMVTQKHDELLTLPDGVAFTLKAGTMIRLEMHYINATQAPLDVSATSTFYTMPEGEFQHEADFLFIGNPDIDIPPMSAFQVGPSFLPLPAAFKDVYFFGITGHTHQYGTNVTVAAAAAKAGPDVSVYDVDNWQWSEPETVLHDPPFQVPDGGGFRFTCNYQNTSTSEVGFGESANDEMCFFWAYYYPSKGAFVCAHSDQFNVDICCPGSPFCDFIF